VQQVAPASSHVTALHDAPTAVDRKADAQATPLNDSAPIDTPTPQESRMNPTPPRSAASARFAAVFAAAIVTLCTLAGIDNLAATDNSAALLATTVAAERA
jgi:hypothetical protein